MSDFKRIRDNVQKMVDQDAPETDIDGYLESEGFSPREFKVANENFGTFMSSVKRGGKNISSLIADWIPIMGATALEKIAPDSWQPTIQGYKERQLGEAAKTQEEIAKKLPAAYESFEDVEGIGDAFGYAKEALGEAIPSFLPGIVTGGVGSLVSRGAVAKAGQVAGEAARKQALTAAQEAAKRGVPGAAEEIVSGLAAQQAGRAGVEAAKKAMFRTELGRDIGGAFVGSATLNIPEAYQSIYSETGQEQLLPAIGAGVFNGLLDAVTPASIIRAAKGKGLTGEAIMGAWYKRAAAGLGKGVLTEGATESLQEITNSAAVKFVDENKDIFTPENLTKFIDAGLRGAIGGGGIQMATDILFGRKPPEEKPAAPPRSPLQPPLGTPAPLPPGVAGPAPSTPLRPEVVGEEGPSQGPERDLAGVVPEGELAAPTEKMRPILDEQGRVIGYEPIPPAPPTKELEGEQLELPLPGQQELFPGKLPEEQPAPTPTPEAKAPEPINLPQTVENTVKEAKKDPSASRVLKGNNPASTKALNDRLGEFLKTTNDDPILAMEQLFDANRTGRLPAGMKALSEAQSELLETVYKRMTGVDIGSGIQNRKFQGAQQAGLFDEAAPAAPEAPAAPTPTMSPEDAWNRHKNDDHPAFGDLSPEEQSAWGDFVKQGFGSAVNFQDIVNLHNDRIAGESAQTPEQIAKIFAEEGKVTTANIENDIKGLDYDGLLDYALNNGPPAMRELMKKVKDSVERMKKKGYKFTFTLSNSPTTSRNVSLRSTAAGHVYPRGSLMELVISGSGSGRPFGAFYEVVMHELLHSVTIPLIRYGTANPNTREGKIVQEIEALRDHVRKDLLKKRRDGTIKDYELQFLTGTNALGTKFGGATIHKADELVSWGMTNADFRRVLEGIKYKGTSALNAFVDIIRRLIGLAPRAETALAEIINLSEQLLGSSTPIAPSPYPSKPVSDERPVSAQTGGSMVGTPPPKQTTKLQPAPTSGQTVRDAAEKAQNAFKGDFWTKWRVGWVDAGSGLSRTLRSLPVFDAEGKLRADMLLRSFNQVINLIKTGLQSGIPVLNADGTIVIMRDANNMVRSQQLADALDDNDIVKASGLSGRGFVATIARALRGEEIQQIDARRREVAAQKLGDAAAQLRRAYAEFKQGNISKTALESIRSKVKAIQKQYKPDLKLNREKQITEADIAWAKQNLEAVPEVQEVLDIWRNINNGLLDLWEKTGLLSKEYAANLRAQKFYVPLYAAREDLMAEEQEGYTGKAAGAKTVAEIEKLEGSTLVRNLWENMDKHYAFMTAKAYNNHVRKMATQQLMSFGIDGARYATSNDDPKNINLRYRDYNDEKADANGIVSIIVDNPLDVAGFQIMQHEMGPLLKTISASTQVLRAGALINPMYWIRQLIRDPIHSSIAGQLDTIVTPFHAMREYVRVLAENSEEAKILAERGVIGQIDPTISLNEYLSQVGTEKVKPSQVSKWSQKLMRMHEASDAATRVAIFKNEKAFALKQGMSEEQAINYAVHKARESINFAVRGNSKTLNVLRHSIPFFSAAITSLDTLYRVATGYGLNAEEKAQAQRIFVKRAAMMALLSTVYAMMMQDDEDYKKLPDNVKDDNWLLPSPVGSEHTFIKIPIPFEIGFLFKTIPEGIVRYMADTSTGKEVLASYGRGFMRSMPGEMILIPQAFKPGLEVVTNYSFFTGRPIEGMSDQGLPTEARGPNASEMAKMLSKYGLSSIGLSPAEIDYLIRGYTAELGTFATGVASTMITEATGKEAPAKNLENQTFFRAFLTDPNTSKAATDFYDIMKNSQEAVNSFNRLKKEGKIEEAEVFISDEERQKLIAVAPALRRIQDQMGKIRARINQIKSDYDRDPEERREEINRLQTMYDQVARQGYTVLEGAGIER